MVFQRFIPLGHMWPHCGAVFVVVEHIKVAGCSSVPKVLVYSIHTTTRDATVNSYYKRPLAPCRSTDFQHNGASTRWPEMRAGDLFQSRCIHMDVSNWVDKMNKRFHKVLIQDQRRWVQMMATIACRRQVLENVNEFHGQKCKHMCMDFPAISACNTSWEVT